MLLPEDLSQKRHNGKSSQKANCGPKLHIDPLYPKLICCFRPACPSSLSLLCSTSLLSGSFLSSFARTFACSPFIQLISSSLTAESHVSLPDQLQGSRRPKGCPFAHLPLRHSSLLPPSSRSVSRQRKVKQLETLAAVEGEHVTVLQTALPPKAYRNNMWSAAICLHLFPPPSVALVTSGCCELFKAETIFSVFAKSLPLWHLLHPSFA